jgi:hypothetical protein
MGFICYCGNPNEFKEKKNLNKHQRESKNHKRNMREKAKAMRPKRALEMLASKGKSQANSKKVNSAGNSSKDQQISKVKKMIFPKNKIQIKHYSSQKMPTPLKVQVATKADNGKKVPPLRIVFTLNQI